MDELQDSWDLAKFEETAASIVPKLQILWSTEMPVATLDDLLDMLAMGVEFPPKTAGLLRKYVEPLMIDGRQSLKLPGRPEGNRLLQAELKLLLCAPRELLLTQEKEWLTNQYLDEAKGKLTQNELKNAKRRAVQNADMCILRAEESVTQFLRKYPELDELYLAVREIVKTELTKQAPNPSPGT